MSPSCRTAGLVALVALLCSWGASSAQAPATPPPGASGETPAASGAASGGGRGVQIAPGTWVARKLPGLGKGPTGGKHQRAAFNPDNGRIYFMGGDWRGPQGDESGRNEVFSYSVSEDRWYLEYPYCGPEGAVQPSHPDEVGWVYDTKRKLFWMVPGYMGGDAGRCAGQARLLRFKTMTFDPGTREWTEAPFRAGPSGEATKFAVYDPVTDSIIRFYYHGGSGMTSQVIALPGGSVKDTRQAGSANGKPLGNARLGEEYAAIDVEGRRVWLIEPVQGRLYRYGIDSKAMVYEADTPASNPTGGDYWPWDCAMPVWDSVNRVLLWPHIPNFSRPVVTLHIYDPKLRTWETAPPAMANGEPVRGNAAVFDPVNNVLVMTGRSPYVYLYRYREGPGR